MKGVVALVLAWVILAGGCAQNPPYKQNIRKAARDNVALGLEYMQLGKKQLAMEKLDKALQQDPDLPAAHNAIAVLYEKLGELELADEHFRRAVRLDPKDAKAHNNYGAFLCRHDRWEEAERHFLKAARDPLYATPETAFTNAGICAQSVGEMEKAEHYFRRALDVRPRHAVALRRMAKLSLARQNYLQTRAYLQRYQEVARHTPETLWIGIQAEQALGDKNAVSSYRLLLKNNFPESAQAKRLTVDE